MGEHSSSYVVVAQGAIINTVGGLSQLHLRGAQVPSNVEPGHLQHLLDNGLVAEGVTGGLYPVMTGDLADVVTVLPVVEDIDGLDDVDGPGPIPPKSAAKADWVAYAVTQGAVQAEAEALTKEDLVAKYGA